ncbi:glutamine ABC transporter ATP-binding protein [Komagataeibacter nataicola]|uniref:Glutamine ABC transporter ATP-binding protein n=1 Tax=Komagataeibacter nataicola TaxID=265960 RepID=A0A9N7H198_9PROT|nr:amino acid ABC transporter ATP-binding protein [Komagataeibacter nataicola]AQU87557.1 glutamine ABC transporter ATP-binding protein [Komagataeibacter nataicola]PYD67072.1 glutamine ABC transporter ATP-binding protein [Komagataeibacter nataicola]WNM09828.1 amino acid ABC transporter ATP-binding protein [Komagataeibacter nataicola]GBR18187.1 amino acid transporter ATP-binding protein [Komagataeibacter nataicola NRIC 0616]
MHPEPGAVLSIRNLSKLYKDFTALDRISLDVRRGEKVVVLGPSGSGKSTLIRCLNRIEPHDSGSLHINGQTITARTDLIRLRALVGLVFQNYNLFPHLNVLDNCALAPRLVRKMPRAQAEALAMRFLQQVNIAGQARKYPIQLSGGQQQRVAIARALCMQPEIMLFDEPTAALDPEAVSGVATIMNDLAAQGITILCVTHEMRFARHIADRIVFMDQGRIMEITPPGQFFTNPQTRRAQDFLNQMIA